MRHRQRNRFSQLVTIILALCLGAVTAFAQGTTAFTYQGRFTDASQPQPTNGIYDFQFTLFDAPDISGNQIGTPVSVEDVTVTNGVFTVQLDFGAAAFGDTARYLALAVRPGASTAAHTLLTPRQRLTPTPYAIRSTSAAVADNATQLNGQPAGQYVQTNDTRLSDDRNPIAGSTNYVQNTTTQQASSSFNIAGDGTAGGTLGGNVVNAATQFNLNGTRILSNPGSFNLFVGDLAGRDNTASGNTFVGASTGLLNSTGDLNAFFGANAGLVNSSGRQNAFFGNQAGAFNTGSENSFFGQNSGAASTGSSNSFFGTNAGGLNTTGSFNVFIGRQAGLAVRTGNGNVFIGNDTGFNNTNGSSNILLGSGANVGSDGLSFATAIGAGSVVAGSNTIVLGRSNGSDGVQVPGNLTVSGALSLNVVNAATQYNLGGVRFLNNVGTNNLFAGIGAGQGGSDNALFGFNAGHFNGGSNNAFFGTSAGLSNITGGFNTFIGRQAGRNILTGSGNVFIGNDTGLTNTNGSSNTLLGSGANVGSDGLSFATAIGAGATVASSNTIALGRSNGSDRVQIYGLGAAGSTQLCRNASNEIATCSSSLRYKTDLAPYRHGLDFINRLQPISFTWKDGGMRDLGFGAEDVAKVDPLLAVYDKDGRVEGVKYDRLSALLVNAVKEQQTQITTLREDNQRLTQQAEALKTQMAALQQAVCALNPKAAVCAKQ